MRGGFWMAGVCVVALAAACNGGSGDDDDDAASTATPGPTDAPSKTFALNGSGFQVAHVGETALVRVFATDSASNVVFCGVSAPVTGGGTFTVSSVPIAVLTTGSDYTVELFANVNGDSTYQTNAENPGNPDHIYSIPLADVDDDVDIDFAHTVQATSITWPHDQGCP